MRYSSLQAFALAMSQPPLPGFTTSAAAPQHGACSACGKTVRVTWSSAPPDRRRCRDCQGTASLPVMFTCANADCGREFTRRMSQVANDHPCCSLSCSSKEAIRRGLMPNSLPRNPGVDRATRRAAKCRARSLRHAQTWDGIGDEEILDRDGWRCRIPKCLYRSRKIDRQRKYPDPRSKAIDHIVPLSRGGDDTAVNKRAAHHGCNMARGNRMGDEQVALFGSIREPPLATVTAGERAVMFQRRKRFCVCGAVPLDGRKFCQECLDRRQAQAEKRAALKRSCRIQIYTCRYCGELKVAKATAQSREVCPARSCQLARLAANNLRTRSGLAKEDADAQVARIVASTLKPAYGRWQRGAA